MSNPTDDGSDILAELLAPRDKSAPTRVTPPTDAAAAPAAPAAPTAPRTRTGPIADGSPSAGAAPKRPAAADPPRPVIHERRRGRGCLVVLAILVVLALAAGAASWWVMQQVSPGGTGEDVALVIPEGTSTSGIATLLEAEGVVTNATIFEYYLRFRGGDVVIQAGDYVLRENASMGSTLATLKAGPQEPPYDTVTIPEGYSVWNGAGLPVPGLLFTALD